MSNDNNFKVINTPTYNYKFNKVDGYFCRWGKTKDDDPIYAPLGPEIVDIEISTICNKNCRWCYKSNINKGKNMNVESYEKIIKILNQNYTLTQIALGIGDIDTNPDLEKILKVTRDNDIVPNITINGTRMNEYYYDLLAKYCGAVSISRYDDNQLLECSKELYSRIDKKDNTLKYINIHSILCKDTYEDNMKFIKSFKDSELSNYIYSIVFLTLKPVGNRNKYNINNKKEDYKVSKEGYKELITYALENNINIGFDSCGCYQFLESIKDDEKYKKLSIYAESCESTLFSIYVNVDGIVFPCSFCEHSEEFHYYTEMGIRHFAGEEQINLLKMKDPDLLMNVWFDDNLKTFREDLIKFTDKELNCRRCPLYDNIK